MKNSRMATLRQFSLLLLFFGTVGFIFSAIISTHYLDMLPKTPVPEEMRMTPRNIHGVVVYQTVEENRKLTLIDGGSAIGIILGLGLWMVYMEKVGTFADRSKEDVDERLERLR
jgi:hypothetical protein